MRARSTLYTLGSRIGVSLSIFASHPKLIPYNIFVYSNAIPIPIECCQRHLLNIVRCMYEFLDVGGHSHASTTRESLRGASNLVLAESNETSQPLTIRSLPASNDDEWVLRAENRAGGLWSTETNHVWCLPRPRTADSSCPTECCSMAYHPPITSVLAPNNLTFSAITNQEVKASKVPL